MSNAWLGAPVSRVDGEAKVTGAAKYSAEYGAPGMVYGWIVPSSIARGSITSIDSSAALKLSGVIHVFTHQNVPKLPWFDRSYQDKIAPPGSPFRPLYKPEIQFSGQPVALVVADTLETARYASTLIRVEYQQAEHETEIRWDSAAHDPAKGKEGYEPPPSARGDASAALQSAPVKIEAEYFHGAEHHNPMEMFGTTVVLNEDGTLIVHDKTQGVTNTKQYISSVFDLPSDSVRVITPFMGGGFGSGLRPHYQVFLAVMAALQLRRSVRLSLTRQQMFTIGYRPATLQKVALGANPDGSLTAMRHSALANTSKHEDYCELVVNWSPVLYQCPNTEFEYKLVSLDLYTPIDMRAPGAATGLFALECAMDELSYAAGIDPIALRLKNYTEQDPEKKHPFSSKELRECYRQGAERFGWEKRSAEPRSMREGKLLVGWGMASGIWETNQVKSAAKAVLTADGKLRVSSGASDIGTGTFTIMTQVAAETLGLPLEDIEFRLGDTALPEATIEGGSRTAASVGPAVQAVCQEIGEEILKLARQVDASPLSGLGRHDVEFRNGSIFAKNDHSKGVRLTDAMKAGGVAAIEKETATTPNQLKQSLYTHNVHSAIFAEVKVDEPLGIITVTRLLNAVAAGRILNAKTARSQVLGAMVFGIGMALEEESVLDHRFGRFINHNYAEYHVPVNADVRDLDVIFVEEHDSIVNPLGVKGLGEIGIIGVAAAIANAVFHATRKRIRDLPITLDKILQGTPHQADWARSSGLK